MRHLNNVDNKFTTDSWNGACDFNSKKCHEYYRDWQKEGSFLFLFFPRLIRYDIAVTEKKMSTFVTSALYKHKILEIV